MNYIASGDGERIAGHELYLPKTMGNAVHVPGIGLQAEGGQRECVALGNCFIFVHRD